VAVSETFKANRKKDVEEERKKLEGLDNANAVSDAEISECEDVSPVKFGKGSAIES